MDSVILIFSMIFTWLAIPAAAVLAVDFNELPAVLILPLSTRNGNFGPPPPPAEGFEALPPFLEYPSVTSDKSIFPEINGSYIASKVSFT